MTATQTRDIAPDLLQEHTDLNHRIDALRDWRTQLCQLGQPRFGELGVRLAAIRDVLTQHFAAEEEGGYLSAALKAAPQFTKQADNLRRQHGDFLEDLEEMVERLTATPALYASWAEACQEFDEFLTRLRTHEHAENEIAQSAFENDVGNAN